MPSHNATPEKEDILQQQLQEKKCSICDVLRFHKQSQLIAWSENETALSHEFLFLALGSLCVFRFTQHLYLRQKLPYTDYGHKWLFCRDVSLGSSLICHTRQNSACRHGHLVFSLIAARLHCSFLFLCLQDSVPKADLASQSVTGTFILMNCERIFRVLSEARQYVRPGPVIRSSPSRMIIM